MIYAAAPTGWVFWLGIPVMAIWGLASPAVQGLMTRRVGPTEQGRLQGAQSSATGIGGLLGPGLFTLTFAQLIKGGRDVPGAPFLLAALLPALAGLLAWRVTRRAG